MGDSKQLFLSFFCLCSLVLFTGTKGKHFCSVECQRIAVNGLEPCGARRMQSGLFPASLMRESVCLLHCVSVRTVELLWRLGKEVSITLLPQLINYYQASGLPNASHREWTHLPLAKPKSLMPSLSLHWKKELPISFVICGPQQPGDRCFSVLWPCPGEQADNQFLTCCL